MPAQRLTYTENQKEVYKFWLGFFEKVTVVIITVAIVPYLIGQLNYVPAVLIVWISFILALLFILGNLSRKLWYLAKDLKLHGDQEVKNE